MSLFIPLKRKSEVADFFLILFSLIIFLSFFSFLHVPFFFLIFLFFSPLDLSFTYRKSFTEGRGKIKKTPKSYPSFTAF